MLEQRKKLYGKQAAGLKGTNDAAYPIRGVNHDILPIEIQERDNEIQIEENRQHSGKGKGAEHIFLKDAPYQEQAGQDDQEACYEDAQHMGLYDAAETESREDSMLPPVLPFAVLEHHIKPAQNQRKA